MVAGVQGRLTRHGSRRPGLVRLSSLLGLRAVLGPARPRDIAGPEFGALRKQAMELLSEEIVRSMAEEAPVGRVP